MSARTKVLITISWFIIFFFIIPANSNRRRGQLSLLRFDPKISTNYNCIFVEARTFPKVAIPWMARTTPADYLRLRYTSHHADQDYGIMFIDPKSMAYEAHAGFSARSKELKGRLGSPEIIKDWMRSQAGHGQAGSDDADARELYDAIVVLSGKDLEHFTMPTNSALSRFEVGHSSDTKKHLPKWTAVIIPLILLWFGGVRRKSSTLSTKLTPSVAGAEHSR